MKDGARIFQAVRILTRSLTTVHIVKYKDGDRSSKAEEALKIVAKYFKGLFHIEQPNLSGELHINTGPLETPITKTEEIVALGVLKTFIYGVPIISVHAKPRFRKNKE